MNGTRSRVASVSTAASQRCENGDGVERGGKEDKDREENEGENWKIAGKSKRAKVICKGGLQSCGQRFADNEQFIMCDMCRDCFHPKCQGVSDDAAGAHKEYDLIWLCTGCKPKFLEAVDVGKKMSARIDQVEKNILTAIKDNNLNKEIGQVFESKIQQMEKTVVEQIKEQHAKTDEKLKEQKEVVQSVPRFSEELKKSAHELKEIMKKKDDKEMRGKNVLLHNIPECQAKHPEERKEYDLASFRNVATALLGEAEADNIEVVNIIRLGKKQEGVGVPKPRLMLIKLKNMENVNKLMKKRTQLREVGFSNIYITRDLSVEGREEQRKLREELNRRGKDKYQIFRGKIVPRQQNA